MALEIKIEIRGISIVTRQPPLPTFIVRLWSLNGVYNDESSDDGGVLLFDREAELGTDAFDVVTGFVEDERNVALGLVLAAILDAQWQSLHIRVLRIVARTGFSCN